MKTPQQREDFNEYVRHRTQGATVFGAGLVFAGFGGLPILNIIFTEGDWSMGMIYIPILMIGIGALLAGHQVFRKAKQVGGNSVDPTKAAPSDEG